MADMGSLQATIELNTKSIKDASKELNNFGNKFSASIDKLTKVIGKLEKGFGKVNEVQSKAVKKAKETKKAFDDQAKSAKNAEKAQIALTRALGMSGRSLTDQISMIKNARVARSLEQKMISQVTKATVDYDNAVKTHGKNSLEAVKADEKRHEAIQKVKLALKEQKNQERDENKRRGFNRGVDKTMDRFSGVASGDKEAANILKAIEAQRNRYNEAVKKGALTGKAYNDIVNTIKDSEQRLAAIQKSSTAAKKEAERIAKEKSKAEALAAKVAEKAAKEKVKAEEMATKAAQRAAKIEQTEIEKSRRAIQKAAQEQLNSNERIAASESRRAKNAQTSKKQIIVASKGALRTYSQTEASIKTLGLSQERELQLINKLRSATANYIRAMRKYKSGSVEATRADQRRKDVLNEVKLRMREASGETGKFNSTLQRTAQVAKIVYGPLNGLASRLVAIKTLFGRNTVGIAAAIGAITAISVSTVKLGKVAVSTQERMKRLSGIIDAQGDDALFSAGQIAKFAKELDGLTLGGFEDFEKAGAALMLFPSAAANGSKSFKSILTAAQGLTEVLGGDLVQNTKKLGRLLEDPVRNFDSLRKTGIVLSVQERERIASLRRQLRFGEANAVIMEKLNTLQNGATEAARSASGQYDAIGLHLRTIVSGIANSAGIAKKLENTLKTIAEGLKVIADNPEEYFGTFAKIIGWVFTAIDATVQFIKKHFDTIKIIIKAIGVALLMLPFVRIIKWVVTLAVRAKGLVTYFNKMWSVLKSGVVPAAKSIGNIFSKLNGYVVATASGIASIVSSLFELEGSKAVRNYVDQYEELNKAQLEALRTQLLLEKSQLNSSMDKVGRRGRRVSSTDSDRMKNFNAQIKATEILLKKFEGQAEEAETAAKSLAKTLSKALGESMSELNKLLPDSKKFSTAAANMERLNSMGELLGITLSDINEEVRNNALKEYFEKNAKAGETYEQFLARLTEQYNAFKKAFAKTNPILAPIANVTDKINEAVDGFKELQSVSGVATAGDFSTEAAKQYAGLLDEQVASYAKIYGSAQEVKDVFAETLANQENLNKLLAIAPTLHESSKGPVEKISDKYIQIGNLIEEVAKKNPAIDVKLLLEGVSVQEATDYAGIASQNIENAMTNLRVNVPSSAITFDKIAGSVEADARSLLERLAVQFGKDSAGLDNAVDQFAEKFVGLFPDAERSGAIELFRTIAEAAKVPIGKLSGLDLVVQNLVGTLSGLSNVLSSDLSSGFLKLGESVLTFSDRTKNMGGLETTLTGLQDLMSGFDASLKERYGESSEKYKKFAKTQATIAGALAVIKAYSADEGGVTGMVTAGFIAAAVGAQIAAIDNANYATGGYVRGPGSNTSDSIPANLSNGEFVMNAKAVRKYGVGMMNMMNQGKMPGFAMGGVVGAATGGGSTTVQVIDQRGSGAPVEVTEGMNPDGSTSIQVLIKDAVKNAITTGEFDRDFKANYGIRRQGGIR